MSEGLGCGLRGLSPVLHGDLNVCGWGVLSGGPRVVRGVGKEEEVPGGGISP